MQKGTNEEKIVEEEEDYAEPFSVSTDSIEFQKAKRVYSLCTIFLPILIIILILSIIVYFLIKEPIENDKKVKKGTINYIIKEKILVMKNDSKPIILFNDHYSKFIDNITSIKINNKSIEIANFHKFNNIGYYLVEITFNKKLKSMEDLFNHCGDIVELDLSGVDTSKVKSMKSAFSGCFKLQNITFGNFNTSSVTDMSYMFNDCHCLTSLDLYNFNTELVEDMSYMFSNASSLKYLNVSSFNTKNVYKMQYMFYLSNLSSIDVSNFNTEKLNYIQYMFASCQFLTSLNLSNFNTKEVIVFDGLFKGNKNLVNIDIRNFYTTKMTSYENVFEKLPKNGSITVNLNITSILLINQLSNKWNIITI